MTEDLIMVPGKWTLTGVRTLTELTLLERVTLRLESLTGLAGYSASLTPPGPLNELVYFSAANQALGERYN
ncbi:hypothetical protein, partial [Salmonella sp. SAL4456]|uniref:hypothetical protein n=1 Tax=Salmonella sp. SAL4456 TaxID=3159911 RepID=UPI0039789605